MGIFGLLDEDEAIKIILDNIDKIIEDINESMVEIGKKEVSINAVPGTEIIWNNINKATTEIPAYIEKAAINVRSNYPYGDPYVFVCCAIMYKYQNAPKEDKKLISSALKGLKKGRIQGLVYDILKSYCDNIKKSLIRPKPYDNQKEDAIKTLASNFEFYDVMFPQKENQNDNGTSRTRR